MQKILSYMRKAIDDYGMIEDGDKIACTPLDGRGEFTIEKDSFISPCCAAGGDFRHAAVAK